MESKKITLDEAQSIAIIYFQANSFYFLHSSESQLRDFEISLINHIEKIATMPILFFARDKLKKRLLKSNLETNLILIKSNWQSGNFAYARLLISNGINYIIGESVSREFLDLLNIKFKPVFSDIKSSPDNLSIEEYKKLKNSLTFIYDSIEPHALWKNSSQRISDSFKSRNKLSGIGVRALASGEEDAIYQAIALEMESREIDKALWTRAFAERDGDKDSTKARYIQLRFEKLKKELL